MKPDFLQAELEGDPAEEVRAATAAAAPISPPAAETKTGTAGKRGRMIANLAVNLGNFAVGIAIGLWFTPYTIHHLGTASYGRIPPISQIAGCMTVVNVAMNSVVGRYVTIAFERHDHRQANQYFNTTLFGNVFLVSAMLGPAVWARSYIEWLPVLPHSKVVGVIGRNGAVRVMCSVLPPHPSDESPGYCRLA